MRVNETSLVSFCPTDYDAVRTTFYNMEIEVRICLCMRSQTTVTFRVSHSAVNGKVFHLYPFEEFHEVFMVFRAIFFIRIIRRGEYRIKSIHANATLEAGSRFLTTQTLHFYFIHQVRRALMNMGEAVNTFASVRRDCCHQVLIFRLLSQIIRHADGVHGRTENRIICRTRNFFTKHVDL